MSVVITIIVLFRKSKNKNLDNIVEEELPPQIHFPREGNKKLAK